MGVGATRDHEPRRGEGSAQPIRRGLAAIRLETSSRRCRRVPAALSGFFAAPGHERRLRGTRKYTKKGGKVTTPWSFAFCSQTPQIQDRGLKTEVRFFFPPSHLPFVKPAKRAFSCAAEAAFRVRRHGETRRVADGGLAPADEVRAGRKADGGKSPTGDSPCRRVRGRA